MSLIDYFLKRDKKSASVARDRLTILVAQERTQRNSPDFLPQLRQDLIDVISKYVTIDQNQLDISLDRTSDCDVLEFNIMIPGKK